MLLKMDKRVKLNIINHNNALDTLNRRYKQAQKKRDNLYDYKAAENITQEFYERKFKQYKEERDEILQSIKDHEKASDEYQEIGFSIYDLSQRSGEIYEKANKDQKKKLLRLVFENLKLINGEIKYKYKNYIEILHEAVKKTNRSEIIKFSKMKNKKSELSERVYYKEETGE